LIFVSNKRSYNVKSRDAPVETATQKKIDFAKFAPLLCVMRSVGSYGMGAV